MKHIAKVVMVLAVVGLLLSAAQGSGADDAKATWEKNCRACHGSDGKGDTKAGKKLGVKDLTAAEVKAGLEKGKMIETIKKGVTDGETGKTKMKAYAGKLSEEQVEALADYVLGLGK
ncbi:MAG: c-type cytochrome [Candidatus Binatia bacterium]